MGLVSRCMVVPRSALFGKNDERCFEGFESKENHFDLDTILRSSGAYIPRSPYTIGPHTFPGAELDVRQKQIVPVGIFTHNGSYFVYSTTQQSTEARLVGKPSVGISGHIEECDYSATESIVERTMIREFHEEMDYSGSLNLEHVGYVNLEQTVLDKVHFGSVYILHGDSSSITVRETEKIQGRLHNFEELVSMGNEFDSWQKVLYTYLLARQIFM